MIQLLGVLGLVGLVGGWVAGFGGAAVGLVGLVWVVCGLPNSVRGLLPPRPPPNLCGPGGGCVVWPILCGGCCPQAPLICVDLSLGLSPRLSLDLSLGLSPRLSLDLSLGLSPRLSLDLSLGLWASGWVTGCEPPIFRTGLCPFIQLSVLDQKGHKKHKNWKTAQKQQSQTTTHHMTAILKAEQQFFNIAECKRAEKPKFD